MTVVDYGVLSASKPYKRLTRRIKKHSGRNSSGRITVRHQGGGNKKLYRLIDFKQLDHLDKKARVLSLEYDPYRTSFIALISYPDNTKKYILAPHGLKAGSEILVQDAAPLKSGNRLKLKNIPIGYQVHNVELKPGMGGKLARFAGS